MYFYALPPEPLPEPPPIEIVQESPYASCVVTARLLGLPLPKGDAKDLDPNSVPTIGGGILLSYDKAEHVAVILAFLNDGFWIGEGNFGEPVYNERLIPYDDEAIRGFVYYK